MKLVVAQLARLALALVALYGALLGLCAFAAPPPVDHAPIDTSRALQSRYLTEPKYVFFARSRLDTERPKLLLLGASNTMAGFKQREVAPLLPEYEEHNISVGGANVTELAQIAELVREVQSPEARRRDTYVIGLWYGVFASDQARWHTPDRHPGDTDIDIERYRYGFYRRGEHGAEPLLPPRYLGIGEALVGPYLVLDRTARDLTASLREKLSGKAPKLSDAERNARVISPDEQRNYLKFWQKYMGDTAALEDAPFRRLVALARRISQDGGRVLLVDLPIPDWHRRGSELARDYDQRLARVLPELTELPNVRAVHFSDGGADDEFSDEVHPKPRVSPRWAARLAEAVRRDFGGATTTDPTASNDHE
jgi:hypothetical protein